MMEMWFEDGQSDERSEFLTEFIFASGSWGSMEQRAEVIGVRSMQKLGTQTGGKLRHLWHMAFPGCDQLKEKYPVLEKAPWLLPAVWVIRPLRKLLFERPSLRQYKRVLKAMTREKVDSRRQMLLFVGLNDNRDN